MIRRLVVREGERFGTNRYYYASFFLSSIKPRTCSSFAPDSKREQVEKDHGERGVDLFERFKNIQGITKVTLSRFQLTVHRLPAIRWKEIEPQVIKALHEVCGDFKLDRGLFLRFVHWIGRNIVWPLARFIK